MQKSILCWELGGIAFIFVLGSVLHFVFEQSGRAIPVAPIATVNEGVWEHLKFGFQPALGYTVVEYGRVVKLVKNFPFIKTPEFV